jgi:hypothetical protein
MIMMGLGLGLGCGRERGKGESESPIRSIQLSMGWYLYLFFLSFFLYFILFVVEIYHDDLDENIFTFLSICENSKCF